MTFGIKGGFDAGVKFYDALQMFLRDLRDDPGNYVRYSGRLAEELAEKHGWFMSEQFDNPANPEYILSVHGVGYRFRKI